MAYTHIYIHIVFLSTISDFWKSKLFKPICPHKNIAWYSFVNLFYLPSERIFKTIFSAFSDNVYSRTYMYNKYEYCMHVHCWMTSFSQFWCDLQLDYDLLLRSVKLQILTYLQFHMKEIAIPSMWSILTDNLCSFFFLFCSVKMNISKIDLNIDLHRNCQTQSLVVNTAYIIVNM